MRSWVRASYKLHSDTSQKAALGLFLAAMLSEIEVVARLILLISGVAFYILAIYFDPERRDRNV